MRLELQRLVVLVADKAVASWEKFTAPWRPTFHPVVLPLLKQQQVNARVRGVMNALEKHLVAREDLLKTDHVDGEMPSEYVDRCRGAVQQTHGELAGALLKLFERDERVEIRQTFEDIDPGRSYRRWAEAAIEADARAFDQTDRVRGG